MWSRPWDRFQVRWGVAKALGRCQTLGDVAKAVSANPNLTLTLRTWGISQGRRGTAKAVQVWPRPWGRGQGRRGVAKAVGV